MKRTLESFGIARSSFYKWYKSYLEYGYDGLETTKRTNHRQWNSIPERQKDLVVEIALEHTELSARELAYKIGVSRRNGKHSTLMMESIKY
ncbi:helix-turn-helix domain-containing protein [Chryseobacterium turcicum]|uniref:Uncharacterized protein n=1 Tax=Chryseobacterium turcicum TaxID=2898076 RepID=A0A9Q3YX17_9FLAO|nr:helix-turn-helix domain-containing protein [Chryseobacterium turcicum]MCD1119156.1 hypothetical protein [Chryseobacterium turcicum]